MENIDWGLVTTIVFAIIGAAASFTISLIVFLRKLDSSFAVQKSVNAQEFAKIRSESRESSHKIDKELHGIKTVMGPHARDIEELKKQCASTKLHNTRLSSEFDGLKEKVERVERQVEAIQNRAR